VTARPDAAPHPQLGLVCRLFGHGVMPLHTPAGGSWSNRAGGLRRILERRALGGQHPSDTRRIIARIEAAGRHWDAAPTPSGWGGKRAARRLRQRGRRHRIGGSGACARAPIPRRAGPDYGHAQAT